MHGAPRLGFPTRRPPPRRTPPLRAAAAAAPRTPPLRRPENRPLVSANREEQEKGTPVGVVYRAHGPALGSWEDRPPAAYESTLGAVVNTRPGP
eukprot:279240-Pyramimonas_sp.AAC.1